MKTTRKRYVLWRGPAIAGLVGLAAGFAWGFNSGADYGEQRAVEAFVEADGPPEKLRTLQAIRRRDELLERRAATAD